MFLEPGSLASQAQSKSMKEESMKTPQPDYWPTRAWQITHPQTLHVDPEALSQLHAYASRNELLHNILVVRSGRIVFEHYYRGWGPTYYHNLFSATKSITSALVGIALREGALQSLDQRLLDFFPEAASRARDPRTRAIALRHLLTMSSGYDYPNEIHKLLDDSETITKIVARPMKSQPGEVFSYDDLDVHLLGRVIARVTDTSLANFALHKLFQPLGIWQARSRGD
jgi:CubicO group peptidase (beta-lactamase class C family)